jgi:Kef-type K+ transport system membrane component KefB
MLVQDPSAFALLAVLVVGLPYLVMRIPGVPAVIPPAVAQMAAGLLLGPSVLGAVMPELVRSWSSPASLEAFRYLGQPAVCLFALYAASHLTGIGRARSLADGAVLAAAGLVSSVVAAAVLAPDTGRQMSSAAFTLACAATALPVMAAILEMTGRIGSAHGRAVLASALASDAAVWLALPLVVAVSGLASGTDRLWWLGPLVLSIVAGSRLCRSAAVSPAVYAPVLLACTASAAFLAHLAGLHAVFGAFAMGLFAPADATRALLSRLLPLLVWVLLPFFFAGVGLRLDLSVGFSGGWPFFAAALGVCVVKAVACALAAACLGHPLRESVETGVLLQTRGVVGIVVLVVLQDAGLLDGPQFSGLALAALVSTASTAPLIHLFGRTAPRAAR